MAGVAVAAYLTWIHFDPGALICGLGDCQTVQASEFATIGPVPVALLGLGMYLVILICNVIAMRRPGLQMPMVSIAFAVALSGAVYAAYLTWLEVAVIGAICQWCVVSAILTLLLAVVEGMAVWRALGAPPDIDDETGPAPAASLRGGPGQRGTSGAGR